jgi:hypothetical protein
MASNCQKELCTPSHYATLCHLCKSLARFGGRAGCCLTIAQGDVTCRFLVWISKRGSPMSKSQDEGKRPRDFLQLQNLQIPRILLC